MAKHIKMQGEVSEIPGMVTVTLLEQTHVGYEFGTKANNDNGEVFGISTDYGLFYLGSHRSCNCKSYDTPQYQDTRYVYLRGKVDDTPKPIIVTLEMWQVLKKAVEAYNEYFED